MQRSLRWPPTPRPKICFLFDKVNRACVAQEKIVQCQTSRAPPLPSPGLPSQTVSKPAEPSILLQDLERHALRTSPSSPRACAAARASAVPPDHHLFGAVHGLDPCFGRNSNNQQVQDFVAGALGPRPWTGPQCFDRGQRGSFWRGAHGEQDVQACAAVVAGVLLRAGFPWTALDFVRGSPIPTCCWKANKKSMGETK